MIRRIPVCAAPTRATLDRNHGKGLLIMCGLACLLLPRSPDSSPEDPAPPDRLEARRQFQDLKFGLFVHWGVYSVLGNGEWVMNNRALPVEEYEKLPALFNPTEFNATEWVTLVREAGLKYITITSKHHDGFAMFDSKVSDWDIVDRTPYKKDVLRALADECHRQNVPLFFYHSHLDWHHPDYFPRGQTGRNLGRPESGEWDRYLDSMDAQLTELLTHYGEIAGIWFDGIWDRPEADWRLNKTYSLIHRLQPQALIGNNHHRKPFPGEDFQMWERDLPGQNTSGFSENSEIGPLPLETCDTLNGSWGFDSADHNYKSPRQLIQYLARAAGNNANFLLNVGPLPSGRIQPEFVERLRAVGQWLKANGDAIYGTRGGPVPPQPWGTTTLKDNRVFVHLLEPDAVPGAKAEEPGGTISLDLPLYENARAPKAERPTVARALLLRDGNDIAFRESGNRLTLEIPRNRLDDADTVILLTLAK